MIENIIEKAGKTRESMIEMLAAAFIKETGLNPSEAVLVQEMAGNKIIWYFKKRKDFENLETGERGGKNG